MSTASPVDAARYAYRPRTPSRLTCPYNVMIGMALQESLAGCLVVQDIYRYIE